MGAINSILFSENTELTLPNCPRVKLSVLQARHKSQPFNHHLMNIVPLARNFNSVVEDSMWSYYPMKVEVGNITENLQANYTALGYFMHMDASNISKNLTLVFNESDYKLLFE